MASAMVTRDNEVGWQVGFDDTGGGDGARRTAESRAGFEVFGVMLHRDEIGMRTVSP